MKSRVWSIVLIFLAALAGSPASAAETRLIDFALEDQFGHLHTRNDVAGKIAVLIGGDGGGGPACRPWTDAIKGELGTHPQSGRMAKLGYADLRSVPFFLRKWARGKFPTDPKEWAMMDWKGKIAKAYEFVPGQCNIVVFAPGGKLVRHAAVKQLNDSQLTPLLDTLRRLLDAGK